MDSNMLDTAMLCNCSGIRTRSVVNEYENMCQSCHKQIRDDRNVVRDRNLREVMVLSEGSEEDEPVYENPVDSRLNAARSNKNSESNQAGSETDGEVKGGRSGTNTSGGGMALSDGESKALGDGEVALGDGAAAILGDGAAATVADVAAATLVDGAAATL